MINERNLDDLKITLNNLKKSIKEVEDVVDRLECPRDWSQSLYTSTVNIDNEIEETYDLYQGNESSESIYSGATQTTLVLTDDDIQDLQLKFDFEEEDTKLQETREELKNVVQFPFPDQQRP
tara:strand:- start:2273 stop:2638 length:366 start_codon:yes stop_codon:yes gene_type:complete